MPLSPKRVSAKPDARRAIPTTVDAFRRVLRALRVAESNTRVSVGISAAQLFVLRALDDSRGASLSELAARTMTDRSSVADVVHRLQLALLVTRASDSRDRRRALIEITPQGRAVLARAPQAPTALLVDALARLSPRELASLARGMVALTSAMDVHTGPAAMLFEDGEPPRQARKVSRRSK